MTTLHGVTPARDQSSSSHSCRQRFSKLRLKENEKYPALVEVVNEKQAAEYLTQWEAFTWPRLNICLEKLSKAAWKLCNRKFSDAEENSWMAAVENLQLAELDNFHNEIRVS